MPVNPESILDSVKQVLGINFDDTSFDLDVVMYINMAFGTLSQAGVGSDPGFVVTDNTTLWSQYVSSARVLGMVKIFIVSSVRLLFDPPATSFTQASVQRNIDELLWRINVAAEQESPPSDPSAGTYWWDLTGLADFPAAAIRGDIGWDSITGEVWELA